MAWLAGLIGTAAILSIASPVLAYPGFANVGGVYSDIDDPSAPYGGTFIGNMNDVGQFVGVTTTSRSFIYSSSGFSYLTNPAGAFTLDANGINNAGDIAGVYGTIDSVSNQLVYHGFVLSNGVYATLDHPLGTSTSAHGINDQGQVVGDYTESGGKVHGFVYDGGSFTTLDGPSAISTSVNDINNFGQVTGNFFTPASEHGYIYSNGAFTVLDDPDGYSTHASAINDSGDVVGYYYDYVTIHGFLYSNGVYTTVDHPAALKSLGYTALYGLNNAGDFSGDYRVGGVPEPAGWVIMMVGFGGLGLAMRRSRRPKGEPLPAL